VEVDCPWVMAFSHRAPRSECINGDKHDLTDLVAAHSAQNDPAPLRRPKALAQISAQLF
jgi:hypothetical protein